MTKLEIETLINSNLADFSNILPTKHREVEHAILDYITASRILLTGTYSVIDPGTDSLQTVSFADVGTSNYIISGSLVSLGSDYIQDNDVIWMVREKTSTSFKLALREVTANIQSLEFDYILTAK